MRLFVQSISETRAPPLDSLSEMPLVVITGWPCSGKSTVAAEIVKFFSDAGKKCELVSDDYSLQKEGRNKLYSGSWNKCEMLLILTVCFCFQIHESRKRCADV